MSPSGNQACWEPHPPLESHSPPLGEGVLGWRAQALRAPLLLQARPCPALWASRSQDLPSQGKGQLPRTCPRPFLTKARGPHCSADRMAAPGKGGGHFGNTDSGRCCLLLCCRTCQNLLYCSAVQSESTPRSVCVLCPLPATPTPLKTPTKWPAE